MKKRLSLYNPNQYDFLDRPPLRGNAQSLTICAIANEWVGGELIELTLIGIWMYAYYGLWPVVTLYYNYNGQLLTEPSTSHENDDDMVEIDKINLFLAWITLERGWWSRDIIALPSPIDRRSSWVHDRTIWATVYRPKIGFGSKR